MEIIKNYEDSESRKCLGQHILDVIQEHNTIYSSTVKSISAKATILVIQFVAMIIGEQLAVNNSLLVCPLWF